MLIRCIHPPEPLPLRYAKSLPLAQYLDRHATVRLQQFRLSVR